MDKIIEMTSIAKRFHDTIAISNGFFELNNAEVHSIIGENGAGKSTLMKILYGIYQPDFGKIYYKGENYHSLSTKQAISIGIGMVHQEFMLVPDFTALENIALGFEKYKKFYQIDLAAIKNETDKYLEAYSINVNLNIPVKNLSVGDQQKVEILKILYRKAEVLIFDEPTAVLTPQEANKLFEIISMLVKSGKSVVFISHKFSEVIKVSDRITVMRQGQWIDTLKNVDINPNILAEKMIGKVLKPIEATPAVIPEDTKPCLIIDNISIQTNVELSNITDFSLTVFPGEIVGIAGVSGNGQTELIEAIAGLRKIDKGQIYICGKKTTSLSPKEIRSIGLAHIPEDRNLYGLNKESTVQDNIIASYIDKSHFSNHFFIKSNNIRKFVEQLLEKYRIHPAEPKYCVSNFSGGNAQKVIVAREVAADKPFLLAAQPTRGIDIQAIENIHRILLDCKSENKGILLISTELDEIFSLSDRIIVLYGGKILLNKIKSKCTEELVGKCMMGIIHE